MNITKDSSNITEVNCTEPRVLQLASESGDVTVLDFCAHQPHSLPSCNSSSSLIDWADKNRHNTSVELICEKYNAEKKEDCNGEFPMNVALRLGKFEVADLFVKHCNATYLQLKSVAPYDTSAHEAARNGTNPILEYFDKKNVMYQDQRNHLGQIPIMLAVEHFHEGTIQYLFSKGARAFENFIDKAGNTILHYTACNPSLTAIEYYSGRLNFEHANKAGETVLFLAVKCNNLPLVKYLVEKNNACSNMYTCEFENPLMAAVKNDNFPMVEYLMSRPLQDPFRKDKRGYRAPDYWKSEEIRNFFKDRVPSITIRSPVDLTRYDCGVFDFSVVRCGDIDFLRHCVNERDNLLDLKTSKDGRSLAHEAAGADQLGTLQWLLEQKRVNFAQIRDSQNNTILHAAAFSGAVRAVDFIADWTNSKDFLLEKNAAGFNALHVAAAQGHDAVAETLVTRWHVSPGIRTTPENDTAALVAAMNKHDKLSLWFVQKEPRIAAAVGGCRRNMLHWASEYNKLALADALCSQYEVRGISDCKGDYPIHLALRNLNFELVDDVLLSKCNEYLFQDKYVSPGGTVAHEAAEMGKLEVLEYLDKLGKGGSYGYSMLTNDDGETPIFLAIKNNQVDIVKYLACITTVNVNKIDNKGNTIIHRMACTSSSDIDETFKCLKELWYNNMRRILKEKNNAGETVLYRATACDNFKLVKDLLATFPDADIDSPASDNTNPLIVAIKRDNYEMVQFILGLGHRNPPTNGSAWAPWEYAKNEKMRDLVRNHFSQQPKVLSKRETRIADQLDYPHSEAWNKSATASIWETGFLTDTILLLDTILKKIFNWKSNYGSNNSDIPLSPPEVIQSKIDPLALEAVRQADHFEDLDDDDENDGK